MISKFYLPSKSSLLKWVSGLSKSPGLSDAAMHVIHSKVRTMSESSRLCTISMDEISIKANLSYDEYKDEIIGLEDFGDGVKNNTTATSALVFMARGILENWKQPLGYYLVHESCNSTKIKEKLLETINKISSISLKVIAVVSDLGSNFQKVLKDLDITPLKPWFMHNGNKIFYLYDAPHLIKAIRNNLLKYNFHHGDKVASWKDIEAIYKKDSALSIRCCPKLTENHIHPNGFKKMKVKYATQVLSHTVAAAISMSVSVGALPTTASGTAEMISKFDQIFDSLNSSSFKDSKIFRRPMSADSPHEKFLSEMVDFISSLRVIDPTTNKDVTNILKCLKGLKLTLNGTLALWKHLQTLYSVQFLITRQLNQNPLENFGSVRQQGSNANNPTPIQFCSAFRKPFYHNILVQSTGNCTEYFDSVLVGPNYNINSQASEKGPQPFNFEDSNYKLNLFENYLFSLIAMTYVAGYLLKKCFEMHKCQDCHKNLVSLELDNSSKLICYFKGYESTQIVWWITGPSKKFCQLYY